MTNVKDLKDVQLALNEIYEFRRKFEITNPNLNGRRFTNVGGARNIDEYVTLSQLNDRSRELEAENNELRLRVESLEKRVRALE